MNNRHCYRVSWLALTLATACGGHVDVSAGAGGASSAGGGAGNAGADTRGGASALGGATARGGASARGGAGSVGGSPASGGAGGSSGATHRPGELQNYLGNQSYPDDFWHAVPSGQVNPDLLARANERILQNGWEIHSLLVAYEGQLVFEQYGWSTGTNPAEPNETPHQVTPSERQMQFSATKSFVSALLGIAVGEGAISSVNQHAVDSFPDYASLNPSPEKSSITLADLLTMRSGLEFSEGEQDTFGAPDPARAMLSRQVVDLPVGQVWNYSSGAVDILTEILRVSTGQTPLDYANAKLFGPIGIVEPPWDAGQTGTQFGGFGLSLTSREMARFGQLFLQNGSWGDKQILPDGWTSESTLPRCPTAWGRHYGYLWWVPDLPDFYNALGAFGQEIFVSPAHSVVIVFTGNVPSDQADSDYEGLIRDYILPALPQPL